MSLSGLAQNLKLAGERFDYAGQAIENVHMDVECPKDIDEYCEKCLPKIVAMGQRYEELPRFVRILVRTRYPFRTYYAIAEFEFCRGILAAYELGLARGRDRI